MPQEKLWSNAQSDKGIGPYYGCSVIFYSVVEIYFYDENVTI